MNRPIFLRTLCGITAAMLATTMLTAQQDARSVIFWKNKAFNYVLPAKSYKITYTADSAIVYRDPFNTTTEVMGFIPDETMPQAPAELVKYLFDRKFVISCEKNGTKAERKVITGTTLSGVPYHSIGVRCNDAGAGSQLMYQLTLFERNGNYVYLATIYALPSNGDDQVQGSYRDYFSWDYATLDFNNGNIQIPIPSAYVIEQQTEMFARLKAGPYGLDPFFTEVKLYGEADAESNIFDMTISEARSDKKAQAYFASRLKVKGRKEIRFEELNSNLSRYFMGGAYSEYALDETAGLVRTEYFVMLSLGKQLCSISLYRDFRISSTNVKEMHDELEEYRDGSTHLKERSCAVYFYEWYAYALKNLAFTP